MIISPHHGEKTRSLVTRVLSASLRVPPLSSASAAPPAWWARMLPPGVNVWHLRMTDGAALTFTTHFSVINFSRNVLQVRWPHFSRVPLLCIRWGRISIFCLSSSSLTSILHPATPKPILHFQFHSEQPTRQSIRSVMCLSTFFPVGERPIIHCSETAAINTHNLAWADHWKL